MLYRYGVAHSQQKQVTVVPCRMVAVGVVVGLDEVGQSIAVL